MITLLEKIQAATTKLIGSKLFPDPTGVNRALRYSLAALPDKRDSAGQGDDFPFCLISPGKFVIDREGRKHQVEIAFGLYTTGDSDDGVELVDDVLTLMQPISREIFTPYKLMGELSGTIDITRHPYYILIFSGEFRKTR